MQWKQFVLFIIISVFASYSAWYSFIFIRFLSWNSKSKILPFSVNMATGNSDWKSANSIYDFSAIDIDGNEVVLDKYRGHVTLIVNLASQCGLTTQNYLQLQALYEKYAESHGLRILGFPCNQFGGQEPGSEPEIKEFIKKYNVQFDMFSKIEVNGNNTHPLWSFLKTKQGGTLGDFIKWNFTKFLIDKNGVPVKRYAPTDEPNSIEPDLLKYFSSAQL